MSTNQTMGKEKKSAPVKVEFGPGRQLGVAGPNGSYIEKSLDRWKLRGSGYLK